MHQVLVYQGQNDMCGSRRSFQKRGAGFRRFLVIVLVIKSGQIKGYSPEDRSPITALVRQQPFIVEFRIPKYADEHWRASGSGEGSSVDAQPGVHIRGNLF